MRPFLTIWAGQLVSLLGSGLTSFAMGVWIYQQTGKVTPFALTVLFSTLPRILLMPLAGSLADRWNRRRIMILADTGSALTTLVIVLMLGSNSLQIWHIYLLVIFSSIFGAFQELAYTASVTMLVPKSGLGRANGLMQLSQALETIASPVIAGVLFISIGLRGILLVDFLTYFCALFTLLLVRIPQPVIEPQEGEKKLSVWKDFVFGLDYLRLRPGLLGLLLYYAMLNFLLNLAGVMTAPLVLSNHSASVLGVVQTLAGVGMLLGSLLISAWGGPRSRRIQFIFGMIGIAMLGMIAAGFGVHPLYPMVGYMLLLFFVPMVSAVSQTIFQSKVAPEVQGRVFSVRSMLSRSMMPLAFLISGPLADLLFEPLMSGVGALSGTALAGVLGTGPGRGIGLLFVLCGLSAMLVSLLAYLNPRIRNVESELPDAVAD
ncbi:MAG: hypothetical protein A2Z16_04010 [Chloroflexi bacterium RBG_16_54_18]|nr:MAG: hypothetical protein A2Z16_04010 [Chloroflexi bacterium RBG_16_54_18]